MFAHDVGADVDDIGAAGLWERHAASSVVGQVKRMSSLSLGHIGPPPSLNAKEAPFVTGAAVVLGEQHVTQLYGEDGAGFGLKFERA